MATVAHSDLTGSDLHEPKGADSASAGSVYISDGAGSGTWSSLATLTGRTGEVFMWGGLFAPTGSLECNGSAVSRTTYADLFAAITSSPTGTRTNGSPIITGLSNGTGASAGLPVSGTGIPGGTTILSVDSGTQITLSANATSSGTNIIVIAPHGVGNGSTTFNVPQFADTGRYPRSRVNNTVTAFHAGAAFSNQNKTHDHGGTISSGNQSAQHSHGVTDPTHVHAGARTGTTVTGPDDTSRSASAITAANTSPAATGITIDNSTTDHHHDVVIPANGGTEARPETNTLIFCIKI